MVYIFPKILGYYVRRYWVKYSLKVYLTFWQAPPTIPNTWMPISVLYGRSELSIYTCWIILYHNFCLQPDSYYHVNSVVLHRFDLLFIWKGVMCPPRPTGHSSGVKWLCEDGWAGDRLEIAVAFCYCCEYIVLLTIPCYWLTPEWWPNIDLF